ncbi:hypothetical protein EJQ19_31400 [Paenibacillus whitsoniae]|uniref:Uncharacterized protein n=2 Tax=Paenibacillus whitsoniae TaxID=2496558 RepID=A0A430J3V0_9BACL|nr:hypothetical protein EJQ19_31400 [Paenibacillus whitsoniae]
MSMPTIPPENNRPSLDEVFIDLLKSIALEETAISHLLNAEAEKMQAFVGKELDFPTCPSNEDIINFNETVSQFVDVLVMKEWLLLRKLENILRAARKQSHHFECEEE